MRKIYKLICIIMCMFLFAGLCACNEEQVGNEEVTKPVSNMAETFKVVDYPQCSHVTREMADTILEYLTANGMQEDIATIDGVTMDVYRVTPVEWWEHMDAILNLDPEKIGGEEWQDLNDKQWSYLVKCDYGEILSVEKVSNDAFDEYEADCEFMDEEMIAFEDNLQGDLDEGMYAGAFAVNGEDPVTVSLRNEKTFLYITFTYPSGHKDAGVYDYALNYLVSQEEQNAFEESTYVVGY